jgi:deoxyribonucleoside regulator
LRPIDAGRRLDDHPLHICIVQMCDHPERSARTPVSDVQQLIQASRLYYELGETQSRVAELLGVTRPQVSRLLKRARAEGIVEIRIVDQAATDAPAGEELRRRFGLAAVHLAPAIAGPDEISRRMIGRIAGEVLRAAIRDGAIVGIGEGASISAVADAIAADEPLHETGATIVPLCGGYWFGGPAREPFRRVADGVGGVPLGLMAPGLVDAPATKTALCAHAGVRRIVELWDRLEVAAFGIGGPVWSAAVLGADVAADLDRSGAVGEILVSPFDLDGRLVGGALRDRTIGFDVRDLGRVPVRIGVAGGPAKVRPILGALRGGFVTELATDLPTAEAVLALDDEVRT